MVTGCDLDIYIIKICGCMEIAKKIPLVVIYPLFNNWSLKKSFVPKDRQIFLLLTWPSEKL